MSLKILQVPASDMANFSYLIFDPASKRGWGVDPSFQPEALLKAATERDIRLDVLANTHGHRDHTAGNATILAATGARLAGHPLDVPEAEIPLTEGAELLLGEVPVRILHTPGHTPGGICLLVPGAIITGDTLFVGRCGRADLPGSDVTLLYQSLCRLRQLPPATQVYPGHDYGPQPVSTIGWERQNNPYLQCPDLEAFIRLRLGA